MFRDRFEAGQVLAQQLRDYQNAANTLVLALPRGGVPVGYEVARELNVPLDVFLVRKLGVPGHEELAMGAIATGGTRILNEDIVRYLQIPAGAIEAAVEREQEELARRERLYRGLREPPDVRGRSIILVDDGLATGASMRAGIKALRLQQPARIIVAVPVASAQTCDELRSFADAVVCGYTPEPFYAVGQGYARFDQTTDGEVQDLLNRATSRKLEPSMSRLAESRTVSISVDEHQISGDLSVPHSAIGVVVFAHGSGSSRKSSRNQLVARTLNDSHLATLLIDLLTVEEESIDLLTTHLRFDIPLLADRLAGATDWVQGHASVSGLPLGYFGASTGAAAALVAAGKRASLVTAIVSRGGRPDLAGEWLPSVKAPTLLIVGERDDVVIELNRQAASEMRVETCIEIVPGATHLFEEPGALERVALLSSQWFEEKFHNRKAA